MNESYLGSEQTCSLPFSLKTTLILSDSNDVCELLFRESKMSGYSYLNVGTYIKGTTKIDIESPYRFLDTLDSWNQNKSLDLSIDLEKYTELLSEDESIDTLLEGILGFWIHDYAHPKVLCINEPFNLSNRILDYLIELVNGNTSFKGNVVFINSFNSSEGKDDSNLITRLVEKASIIKIGHCEDMSLIPMSVFNKMSDEDVDAVRNITNNELITLGGNHEE